MDTNYKKVLELKSTVRKNDKHFLKLRLLSQENIELYIEIDQATINNIDSLMKTDRNYKYRLSFNSYYDGSKQQYFSKLTKTYKDHSEKILFMSSEKYVNALTSISNIKNISDLENIPFVRTNLEVVEPISDEQKDDILIELSKSTKTNPNWLKRTVFTFSSALALVFIYLLSSGFQETITYTEVIAESLELDSLLIIDQSPAQTLVNDNKDSFMIDDSVFNANLLDKSDLSSSKIADENIVIDNIDQGDFTLPSFQIDDLVTYALPKGKVALTFDDGPSSQTLRIVDTLKDYNVGGTFFFVGQNVQKYPEGVEYTQNNGYSIGSHSINHPNLRTLSYDQQKNEIIGSIDLLEEITKTEIKLFRPPYGAFDNSVKKLMTENNYNILLWNNDPRDWESRNSDAIFNHIQKTDVSGSIILFHETKATLDALPRIIEYLQELNLEIVNLE